MCRLELSAQFIGLSSAERVILLYFEYIITVFERYLVKTDEEYVCTNDCYLEKFSLSFLSSNRSGKGTKLEMPNKPHKGWVFGDFICNKSHLFLY